jgi:2-polyprenyl-3-methyl-5-hydroxy-6-metoxy-1,4-benzoquinol methylase
LNSSNLATDADAPHTLKWTADLVRKFWNYHARFPDKYFSSQYGVQIALAIGQHLPSGSKVLDYACGTGALTTCLLQSGFEVSSCDLSSDSVTVVNESNADHPKFMGATIMDGLYSVKEKFDAVTLVELVEHVEDDILEHILNDVRNVLKPDGVIIITTPNNEDLTNENVYCPVCNHTFHRWQHVRSWSAESLGLFLKKNGFNSVQFEITDFSHSRSLGNCRYLARYFINFIRKKRHPHLIVYAKKFN